MFVVLLDADVIFGGADTELLHRLGIDVEAAGRLALGFGINFLAFFAEQPVDENFCGIGMGRFLIITGPPLPMET